MYKIYKYRGNKQTYHQHSNDYYKSKEVSIIVPCLYTMLSGFSQSCSKNNLFITCLSNVLQHLTDYKTNKGFENEENRLFITICKVPFKGKIYVIISVNFTKTKYILI